MSSAPPVTKVVSVCREALTKLRHGLLKLTATEIADKSHGEAAY